MLGFVDVRIQGGLADEGREHLHDHGVLSGRVAGEALQVVDTAQADVELSGAELLDRLGVAVGDATLLARLEGTACDVDVAAHVVPRDQRDQRDGDHQRLPVVNIQRRHLVLAG